MKSTLISLFLLCTSSIFSQFVKKDTLIIKKDIFECLFSYTYGQPRYVKYVLYKGGGNCNRSKERFGFKSDSIELPVSNKDYENSGYEQGHMANAEDFAFDCKKEEQTFRFYNCVPQTPKLNKGIWRTNENLVRKWSQTDSLVVICGGIYSRRSKKITNNLIAPDKCYKVVISLKSHKLLQSMIYDNNDSPKESQVDLINIEAQVHFFFSRLVGFSIKNENY